jgi:hypothetical protein
MSEDKTKERIRKAFSAYGSLLSKRASRIITEYLESQAVGSFKGKLEDELSSEILPRVFRDVGLTITPDAYDVGRFADFLREEYSGTPVGSIQTAFELAARGELNNYIFLQRGETEPNHFGQFSIKYYSKVFKGWSQAFNEAFKELQRNVKTEPPKKRELSEAEKVEIARQYRESIAAAIKGEGRFKGWAHSLKYSRGAFKVYQELGFVPEVNEPSKDFVEAASLVLMKSEDSTKRRRARDGMNGNPGREVLDKALELERKDYVDKILNDERQRETLLAALQNG